MRCLRVLKDRAWWMNWDYLDSVRVGMERHREGRIRWHGMRHILSNYNSTRGSRLVVFLHYRRLMVQVQGGRGRRASVLVWGRQRSRHIRWRIFLSPLSHKHHKDKFHMGGRRVQVQQQMRGGEREQDRHRILNSSREIGVELALLLPYQQHYKLELGRKVEMVHRDQGVMGGRA